METKRKRTKEAEAKHDCCRAILKHKICRGLTGIMLGVAFVPCVGVFTLATSSDSYSGGNVNPDRAVAAAPLATEVPVTTTATRTVTTTSSTTITTSVTTSSATTSATTTTTSAVETTTTTEVAVAETEASEEERWKITRVSDEELVMLAKTLAQEGGCCSYTQQCCVIWTVLNRVDSCEWPNTVYENLVKPDQFAYKPSKEYTEAHYQVVLDVVSAWENGGDRLLGPDYQYFRGDGWQNHFYGKNSPEIVPD